MKINKLRAISIVVCCLVISLWGQAQSTNQLDILELDTNYRTGSMQTSFQNEIDALDLVPTPLQSINLEDYQDAWGAYLISPFKSTITFAYEFLKLATNNPKLAAVVGMCYMLPVISAGCQCFCSENDIHGRCHHYSGPYLGCATGLTECANICGAKFRCGMQSCSAHCD